MNKNFLINYFSSFVTKIKKNNVFRNLFLNLFLMVLVIFSGHCVAVKILSQNQFFVKHIEQIKSQENIFDKTLRVLKQDSISVIKKYFEFTLDSFIESEKIPSAQEVKNFFLLLFDYLDKNMIIKNLEKKDDRYILTCDVFFSEDEQFDCFLTKLKNFNYISKITCFKPNNKIYNNIFIIKIELQN